MIRMNIEWFNKHSNAIASTYKLFMLSYRVKWLIMIEGILFCLSVLVGKQRWIVEVNLNSLFRIKSELT